MSNLSLIHDHFILSGFIKVSSKSDLPETLANQFEKYCYLYLGTLSVDNSKFNVEVVLCFQSIPFDRWPKCFLAQPDKMKKFSRAHIEPNGAYCYIDPETNNLDVSRPLESLDFTIESIKRQLSTSLNGNNKDDVAIELPLYLENKNITEFYDDHSDKFECIEHKQNGLNKYVIRPAQLDENINSLLWNVDYYQPMRKLGLTKIRLDSPPNNNEELPLNSFKSLVTWLAKNQPSALAQLTPQLHKNITNKNVSNKQVILFQYKIDKDTINFVVILSLSTSGIKLFKSSTPKRLRKVLAAWNDNSCTDSFYTSRVMNINPVDGIKRNIPERNLLNLRIALIGAGTLGGYVAEQLVNLGAGLSLNNKAASIDIFDDGILEPENLSRHILGYSSLWRSKAGELVKKLKNDNPLLANSLKGVDKKISSQNISSLNNYDLIINATGDQHASDILNYYWYKLPINKIIIHGWIEGGGLGSRVLRLHDKKSCFRCLRLLNNKPRFNIFKNKNEIPTIRKACGVSYMPFPATVSIRSASFVVEASLDAIHLNKENYIYFDEMSEQLTPHQNKKLTQYKQCPVCS